MRILSDALIAAQKKTNQNPAAQVIIDDRYVGVERRRWTLLRTGTEADGPVRLFQDYVGTIIRARIDPAAGILYAQRVTDPTTSAGWATWTNLATSVSPTSPLAVAWDGTTTQFILWIASDNRSIKYRETTDNGVTWAAAATAYTAAAGHTINSLAATLNLGYGILYVFFTDTTTSASQSSIYTLTRAESGGAWTGPLNSGRSPLSQPQGMDCRSYGPTIHVALADSGNIRLFDAPINALTAWPPAVDVLRSDNPTIKFSKPQIVADHAYFSNIYFIQTDSKAATTTLRSSRYRNWGQDLMQTRPHNIPTSYPPDASDLYLVTASKVWSAPQWTPNDGDGNTTRPGSMEIDVSANVLTLSLQEKQRAAGELKLTLNNNDGRYASELGATNYQATKRGSQIAVRLGLTIQGEPQTSLLRPWWITQLTHNRTKSQSRLVLTATDAWGILERTRAARTHQWDDKAIKTILYAILQGLGLYVQDDSNAIWDRSLPHFTIAPNATLASAVVRLLDLAGGEIAFAADPDWYDIYPSATAYLLVPPTASAYTIGNGHDIIDGKYTLSMQAANHAVTVAPDTATKQLYRGEAIDYDEIDILDAEHTTIDTDRLITSQAEANAQAAAVLQLQTARKANATVTIAPHVGLEIHDVVTLYDSAIALAAAYAIRQNTIILDHEKGEYKQILELEAQP